MLSLDDGDQITGCYDPGWLMPTGISCYALADTTSPIGRVLAFAGDNFNTDAEPFSVTAWLVQVLRQVPGTNPTNLVQHAPGLYVSGGSSLNPPLQTTLYKAAVPAMNKTGSSTVSPCRTYLQACDSNDYLLVYSVGKNKMDAQGFTNVAPLSTSEPSNAQDVNQDHTTDLGFWANALSNMCPTEDRVTLVMKTAVARDAESALVDRIMTAIQRRFDLQPVDEPESDSEEKNPLVGVKRNPAQKSPHLLSLHQG